MDLILFTFRDYLSTEELPCEVAIPSIIEAVAKKISNTYSFLCNKTDFMSLDKLIVIEPRHVLDHTEIEELVVHLNCVLPRIPNCVSLYLVSNKSVGEVLLKQIKQNIELLDLDQVFEVSKK